jgi:hypothetical protein
MKYTIVVALVLLLSMQFVLADIPPLPSEKVIPINHQITNINDYQDYIFFATADNSNNGPGFSMCPLEIVGSDGIVKYSHYKLCSISVYAIKKTDATESQLKTMDENQLESLVNSASTYKLFTGFYFSKTVSDSSSETEENVSHTIDSNALTSNNNNQNNNQNKNNSNWDTKTCPVGSTNEEGVCKKTLSNGRVAEIKIMPETASERAIGALGDIGFTTTLKEVGKADESKPVYELTGNKQGKFLGIFKITARVQAQVDAESGEVKVIKPWWSFLASGI